MESHMTFGQILRNSMYKLLFEFIGTMFLTITFNCTLYKDDGYKDHGSGAMWSLNQTALFLVLWVLTIFGISISGAHYNPAISLAMMLKRDTGKFPRPLGLAYIISQCLGGFAGALLSWFLRSDTLRGGNITIWDSSFVAQAMIQEALGAFFVSFFYLIQSEPTFKISNEKGLVCLIMASSYVGARAMMNGVYVSVSGAVLNPAIGIGTNFTQLFKYGADRFEWVWIYGGLPFAGAIGAAFFHEFVFKKTQELYQQQDGEDDDDKSR